MSKLYPPVSEGLNQEQADYMDKLQRKMLRKLEQERRVTSTAPSSLNSPSVTAENAKQVDYLPWLVLIGVILGVVSLVSLATLVNTQYPTGNPKEYANGLILNTPTATPLQPATADLEKDTQGLGGVVEKQPAVTVLVVTATSNPVLPTVTLAPTATDRPSPTPWDTPTPTPTPTPTVTSTSLYMGGLIHGQEMEQAADRRISFAKNFGTFVMLPVVFFGLSFWLSWQWFLARDRLLEEKERAQKTTEQDLNKQRLAQIPINDNRRTLPVDPFLANETSNTPAPTIEQAVEIMGLLLSGKYTRSGVAVEVFGGSGSNYLPKVDMIGEQLKIRGLLEEYPPPSNATVTPIPGFQA